MRLASDAAAATASSGESRSAANSSASCTRWKSEGELTRRAQALRRRCRVQALLVTRSEEGMTLYDANGRFHVPVQAREVYDVSGAGDTVIATLAAGLAAGLDMPTAVRLANRAAGIVVGKFGTAVVHPEELFGSAAVQGA